MRSWQFVAAFFILAAAPASTSARGGARPEIRREAIAWNIVGVSANQRTLEVGYLRGCGGGNEARAKVRESRRSVFVDVSAVNYDYGVTISCPPPERAILRVALSRPIAGRRIYGRSAAAVNQPIALLPGEREGGKRVAVPRVLGLSPIDAERTLHVGYLRDRKVRGRAARGLPRIVDQQPRPGTTSALGTVVRLGVSSPRR